MFRSIDMSPNENENIMATSDAVNSKSSPQSCKIIIIGAGMSGLSAANHFIKNNMNDFVVLEGRKRIGGRIMSIKIGENKFELGANWIHGVLGNPMYEIAMAHNLIDIVNVPKPHKVVAATEDGKQVPFKTLKEIYEAYMCFLHRCEEYFLCQYLPPEGVNSVGEHISLEAAMYLNNITDSEERRIRTLIFDCLLKRETCISGCDSMSEIDLLELGSYTELQGGNIVLPSGYSSILSPISEPIPPDNLLTEHNVTSVRWRQPETVVSSEDGNDSDDSDRTVTEEPLVLREGSSDFAVRSSGSSSQNNFKISSLKKSKDLSKPFIEVTCENGTKFISDSVICTVPLGVLKEKADTLFSPKLPQYKLDAIDRLLFGTVDKIFLIYERPFLNPDISEVMLLWNSTDPQKPEELSECWFRKIYSFCKVSETVLLGWLSGREAEFMETLTLDDVADTCTNILRKFLNDPFVPKPKQCICTHWHSEKFTRGSYTAIAVGATQADIENLAQPLYASPLHKKPAVLFAGEHTHSSFYSTVHGAYLSGRTAATLLLAPDASESQEVVIECDGTNDLSSWIQGISLE